MIRFSTGKGKKEKKTVEERRWCRERRFNFSLRSTKIGWSSSDGPRFKVGVLGKGYA